MTSPAAFEGENVTELTHGIRENLEQFLHQLLQVLLVGFAIGMMRTVVPALAESEFGVARGSFLMLTAFVVAFGVVKGVLNFVAGRLSERIGRKHVLMLGWIAALPIPFMIYFAPNWNWIVAATVLLGINQGLAWSMTQTAKLDITRADERGLTIGLNEFSGYVGVALAGIITGYAATALGPRLGLLVFGLVVVVTAIVLTQIWVRDTLPWAKAEAADHAKPSQGTARARYPKNISETPTTWEVFTLMSWRDRRLAAISQAGLVEKFGWTPIEENGQPIALSRGGCSITLEPGGLDRRRLWLGLGRIAAFYRSALGPCRTAMAKCARHVDLRCRCRHGDAGRWIPVVVRVCRRNRFRYGAPLSEPLGGGGGYLAGELARLGHRHLSLLA